VVRSQRPTPRGSSKAVCNNPSRWLNGEGWLLDVDRRRHMSTGRTRRERGADGPHRNRGKYVIWSRVCLYEPKELGLLKMNPRRLSSQVDTDG